MKKTVTHPAIDVLEKEMSLQEQLDPEFFVHLKEDSISKALSIGIDPETVKKLFKVSKIT